MWTLALILLVLDRFDSPALAGLCGLLSQIGVLLVPLAGAILDNYGNKRLIVIDYTVSAVLIATIGVLSLADSLSREILIITVVAVGLTSQCSALGLRTVLPLTIPAHMWDRANGLTFSMRAIGRLISPLIVALIASAFSPAAALLVAATIFGLAAIVVLGYTEPRTERSSNPRLFRDAADGITYTLRNRMLRNISILSLLACVGWGALYGALPPLVKNTMHMSTLFLGIAYACFAVSDILSGILFGRKNTEGREWLVLTVVTPIGGCGFLLMATGSTAGVLLGICLIGICETPFDQVAYGIRQRWTEPTWMGRTTSIAIAIPFGGFAVGTALTGAIAEQSGVCD